METKCFIASIRLESKDLNLFYSNKMILVFSKTKSWDQSKNQQWSIWLHNMNFIYTVIILNEHIIAAPYSFWQIFIYIFYLYRIIRSCNVYVNWTISVATMPFRLDSYAIFFNLWNMMRLEIQMDNYRVNNFILRVIDPSTVSRIILMLIISRNHIKCLAFDTESVCFSPVWFNYLINGSATDGGLVYNFVP